jgi:transcriptional regulator with XRE-family HTH domain
MRRRYKCVSRSSGARVEVPQGTSGGRPPDARHRSSTISNMGERLRLLRIAKHLSQETLARRTGLQHQNISAFENNHSVPTLDTLEKLARGLECKLHELFYGDEDFSELASSMSKEQRQQSGPDADYLATLRAALARMTSKERKHLSFMTEWMANQKRKHP